jgi:hypothetical protein
MLCARQGRSKTFDYAPFRGDHWNNKKNVTSIGLAFRVLIQPKAEPFVTELRFQHGDLESSRPTASDCFWREAS